MGSEMKKYISSSYNERGFKNRVLLFENYKFTKFTIDDAKFKDNKAFSYDVEGSPKPRFLNFTESDFI